MLLLGHEYKTKYTLRQTHRLLDVVLGVTFQATKYHFKTQVTFLANLLRYRNSIDMVKLQKYHVLEKFKRISMFKKELLHFEIIKKELQILHSHNPKLLSFIRLPISTHYPIKLLNPQILEEVCLEYDDGDDTLDDVSEDYRESRREEIETVDTVLDYQIEFNTEHVLLDSNECTLV
jgi:hypothetical protein